MPSPLRRCGAAAALLAAAACASGSAGGGRDRVIEERVARPDGADIRIENISGAVSGNVDAPRSAVWDVLVEVYRELGLRPTTTAIADGILAADGFRMRRIGGRRPSRWVDCGQDVAGAVADEADVTASVSTRLRAVEDSLTVVSTEVEANARRRASATGSLHCTTTGRLERRILDAIYARVAGEAGPR